MAKNMTRKGLAFGAGIALVASGFAAVPASANGIDNGLVTLVPTTGTQYDQLQALTLDLTGAFANAAASGGSLKFLVTDSDQVFKVDVDVNNGTSADDLTGITTTAINITNTATTAAVVSGKTVTLTTATNDFKAGDKVTIGGTTFNDGAGTPVDLKGDYFLTGATSTTITFDLAATPGGTVTATSATVTFAKTAQTGNATRAEIAAAPLGSRSVLGNVASVSARSASGSFVVDTKDTASAGVDNVLRLVSTAAADTSATATVTAWIDNNNDGVIQTTEYASPARSVRFLKNADVTFTTSLTAPVLGGTTLASTVSISNVNMSQIPNATVTVAYKKDGASYQSLTAVNANYSSADGVLVASSTGLTAHAAGIYSAQASYASAERGAASFATTTAAAVDISSVSNPEATNSASVAGTSVKTGTTAVKVSSEVKYWSTYHASTPVQSLVAAGVPAVVTITKVTLASGSTVSAGGKTLASSGTSISYDTTTNADGEVVVDLSATGTKGTSVTINIKVADENTATDDGSNEAGTTGGYKTSSADLTLTWADATISSINLVEALGYGGEMGIAKGSTNTLSYDIRDNFGASSAVAGTYRVSFALSSVTGGASWTGTSPVSSGKASFTFTDNTVAATGVYTVTATLQKLNTAGTAYDTDVTSTTTVVRVGEPAIASVTTTAKAESNLAIEAEDFVSHDLRLDANSVTFPYTATGFQVTGVVRDATGAPVRGAKVIVSAPGVAFAAPQTTNFTTYTAAVLSVGTATAYTNSSGQYSVTAWSHKAGANTFTVTAGTATATTSQTWAFPTTVNKDSKIVFTAPASALPASVAKGTVTLTDKRGNIVKGAISITFTQTGPGYIVSTPTAVSATTGSADFVLLTGANDKGTSVITVKHDSGTVATTDDVSASVSIVIGTVAGTQGTSVKRTGNTVAVRVTGYAKSRIVLNGARVASRTSLGTLTRTLNLRAGRNVIQIVVDGKVIRTVRYTR